jgi:ADP-ribose pyrophosphatase YjhB (NUDIX family)
MNKRKSDRHRLSGAVFKLQPASTARRIEVYGWVQDEFGRVLLTMPDAAHAPSWTLPGGSVAPGESLPAAVERHFRDTLGLRLQSCEPASLGDQADDGVLSVLFRVTLAPGNAALPMVHLQAWDRRRPLPAKASDSLRLFWPVMRRLGDHPPTVLYAGRVTAN